MVTLVMRIVMRMVTNDSDDDVGEKGFLLKNWNAPNQLFPIKQESVSLVDISLPRS